MDSTNSTAQGSTTNAPGDVVPAWLLEKTFAVNYNPNCPKPWLIRMPSVMAAGLDNKGYTGNPEERTKDALGFGATCAEAALAAQAVVDAQRAELRARLAQEQARRFGTKEERRQHALS